MQVYNVEVFHRDFSFVHNYTVEDITYKYDYLTPVENEVMMSYNANVKMGDYIVLRSEDRLYEGVISSIKVINKDYMTVGYSPLNSLFSTICYVNRLYQQGHMSAGQKSIEQIIYEQITRMFINGYVPYPVELASQYTNTPDELQKITGLTLTKSTDTYTWELGLTENGGYDITYGSYEWWLGDLYEELIPRALKGCSVGVITKLDVNAKKIYCNIGVLNPSTLTIESDLPQILDKNIVHNDTSSLANKYVEILPSQTGDPPDILYRHPDGTWDRNNTDRLTPVITEFTESYNDMGDGETIETHLFNKYGGVNYVNLIELTTPMNVYDLEFGDIANVIVGNNTYVSMLTGYEIHGDIIKYIFGMLRLDLTKILKRRL